MAVLFETETCSRCGGSGSYSYCQRYGTTCFKCSGRKVVLTKRGVAAQAFYRASFPTKLPLDLAVGDRFSGTGMTAGFEPYSTVHVVVEPPAPSTSYGTSKDPVTGAEVRHAYVDVLVEDRFKQRVRHGMVATSTVTVIPSAEARKPLLEAALAYQATLTKAGTPRRQMK